MRIHFPNMTRPKAAAKSIAQAVDGVSLSKAQAGLALALGYKDWHELEQSHAAAAPSALDQDLAETEAPGRIADLSIRLADALDLYRGDAATVLVKSRATGDLKLDEWLSKAIASSIDGHKVLGRETHAAMNGFRVFTMKDFDDMRNRRPYPSRDRADEPNRLEGQIPFPPAARIFVEKLVRKYELDEEVPVTQAYYRDRGSKIRAILQFGIVIKGKVCGTEHDSFTFKKSDLDWDLTEVIAPRSKLPGFRADDEAFERIKEYF